MQRLLLHTLQSALKQVDDVLSSVVINVPEGRFAFYNAGELQWIADSHCRCSMIHAVVKCRISCSARPSGVFRRCQEITFENVPHIVGRNNDTGIRKTVINPALP